MIEEKVIELSWFVIFHFWPTFLMLMPLFKLISPEEPILSALICTTLLVSRMQWTLKLIFLKLEDGKDVKKNT